jgi:hypothetical protein
MATLPQQTITTCNIHYPAPGRNKSAGDVRDSLCFADVTFNFQPTLIWHKIEMGIGVHDNSIGRKRAGSD